MKKIDSLEAKIDLHRIKANELRNKIFTAEELYKVIILNLIFLLMTVLLLVVDQTLGLMFLISIILAFLISIPFFKSDKISKSKELEKKIESIKNEIDEIIIGSLSNSTSLEISGFYVSEDSDIYRCNICYNTIKENRYGNYPCCELITHLSHAMIWNQRHSRCPYCNQESEFEIIVND